MVNWCIFRGRYKNKTSQDIKSEESGRQKKQGRRTAEISRAA